MPNLVRSRGWGRVKPPPSAQIDRGHPLAQDLAHCIIFNAHRPADLAFGQHAIPGSTVAWGPRQSPRTAAAGTDTYTFKTRGVTVGERTWMAYANLSSAPAANGGMILGRAGNGGDSTSTHGLQWQGSTSLAYNWSDNVAEYGWVSGLGWKAGVDSIYACAVSAAQAVACVDGKFAINVRAHAAKLLDGTHKVGGDYFQPTARVVPGDYHMVAIWNRALTIQELTQLSTEPYAFIAPPGPKVFYMGFKAAAPAATNSGQFFAVL